MSLFIASFVAAYFAGAVIFGLTWLLWRLDKAEREDNTTVIMLGCLAGIILCGLFLWGVRTYA